MLYLSWSITTPPRPCVTERSESNELISRIARNGDRRAFEELFLVFAPKVKAMLMRQGANPATAEEIAQEALFTVWKKAALYAADRGTASTWIFTIARNLRIDRLRREVAWQALGEEHEETAADGPLPDEIAASNELQKRVRAVLDGLPAEQVQVVMLSYVDGLSHSDIAERTGLPLGTIKSRMRLAYQKVRDAFEVFS